MEDETDQTKDYPGYCRNRSPIRRPSVSAQNGDPKGEKRSPKGRRTQHQDREIMREPPRLNQQNLRSPPYSPRGLVEADQPARCFSASLSWQVRNNPPHHVTRP
jgi:hypothetical protein